MSKQFRIFLFIFLGLLAAAVILHISSGNSTFSKRTTGFAVDDINQISAIIITKEDREIKLEKTRQGWYINDKYPADSRQMFNFLRALHNLRIKSPVALSEQERILNLLRNEGTEVRIKKRWKSRILRVFHAEDGPTYMVLGNSRSPFLVEVPGLIGEAGELFSTEEGYWRENVVFSYLPGQISSVKVEYPSGMGLGFRIIAGENNRYSVYPDNSTDPLQFRTDSLVFSYLTYFSYVPFTKLLTASEPELLESLKREIPFANISLTISDTHQVAIRLFLIESKENKGEYDPNILYGLINNDNDLVTITFVNVDLILKEVSWFMQYPL